MGNSLLFFHELTHLFLSIAAGMVSILFIRKKISSKKWLIFLSLAGGLIGEFFLDSDHIFDYIFAFGLKIRPDFFFSGEMFRVLNKSYVPFHSWELVIIFSVLSYFIKNRKWKIFLAAITFGILFHLTYDMFFNRYDFLGYSFVYRWFFNFNPKYFTHP